MAEIVSGAGYATFINTFRCKPSNQDDVVEINIEIVDRVDRALLLDRTRVIVQGQAILRRPRS